MSSPVVADAGPLIGLARIEALDLLRELYQTVVVPSEVAAELRLDDDRPGSRRLREAVDQGWVHIVAGEHHGIGQEAGGASRGQGETAAIALALRLQARFLLIDDRGGRNAARRLGLPVVGTGGILLAAKRRNLLGAVRPSLKRLAEMGYRLSPALCQRILELAGEAPTA